MTSTSAGRLSTMTPRELLLYWIKERYNILQLRRSNFHKPWSDDPVFQTVYFCNVHRENDRVTKWIRKFYSPHVNDAMFEYNIVLARFLNWPDTLQEVGYQYGHEPHRLQQKLETLAGMGKKIWGGAYIITTHGLPMGKVPYLCHEVLDGVYTALERIRTAGRVGQRPGHLQGLSAALEGVEGIGTFLAAQVVADLKNTQHYAASFADDWWTFVKAGPGSIRGASWFHYGEPKGVTASNFYPHFAKIRSYVNDNWPEEVPPVCNQDLQNCLCEFDKYMRVSNGTGRSKRNYSGRKSV